MLSIRSPAGGAGLSDEELRLRTRAVEALLEAATRADATDALAGFRDLLRETLDAARHRHGEQAVLGLLVDELVRALDDAAQVEWLLRRLRETVEQGVGASGTRASASQAGASDAGRTDAGGPGAGGPFAPRAAPPPPRS